MHSISPTSGRKCKRSELRIWFLQQQKRQERERQVNVQLAWKVERRKNPMRQHFTTWTPNCSFDLLHWAKWMHNKYVILNLTYFSSSFVPFLSLSLRLALGSSVLFRWRALNIRPCFAFFNKIERTKSHCVRFFREFVFFCSLFIRASSIYQYLVACSNQESVV